MLASFGADKGGGLKSDVNPLDSERMGRPERREVGRVDPRQVRRDIAERLERSLEPSLVFGPQMAELKAGRHTRSSLHPVPSGEVSMVWKSQAVQDADGSEQAIAGEVGVGSDYGGIQAALLRSGLECCCAK